uniref:Uncharacterized protein n=1 Tax=Arundo donax TaxID=35708 RepID=A0A0A9A214_ARUDO
MWRKCKGFYLLVMMILPST